MEYEGLHKLKVGDFNNITQTSEPDGSVTIVLEKRGENKLYKLKVKDLYGPTEEVLEYEEEEL